MISTSPGHAKNTGNHRHPRIVPFKKNFVQNNFFLAFRGIPGTVVTERRNAMKVTEGIYAYIWTGIFENNCNMFYLGDPLNILIDPGLKNYVDVRFEQMKKDGLDPEKIQYILNTHCHPDHMEGSLLFEDKDIKIAMLQEEIDFYNQEGPGFFRMFGMPFPKLTFDVPLKEGTWNVNGTDLEVFHTPGHSPGSLCLYWPEKKALVCGDLVFEQSFGRVDFPGGDGRKLVESIKKVSGLDVEILLPGHMNFIQGKQYVQRNFREIEQYFHLI